VLGGSELLVMIVMALGLALLVGNVAALTRPRRQIRPGELRKAPRGRSLAMAAVGLIVFLWGLASLLNK
jgi:uncharacterized membrane protein YidH (DUF202 family)